MKAVILEKIGKYAVTDRPMPQIKESHDLLVRVDACSICGSDLHILSDPPGYPAKEGVILGHEMVGTVIKKGENAAGFQVGDRVVCDNNIPCGRCYFCRSGKANMCENVMCLGVDGDGFFAQYSRIPDFAAVKISEDLPLDIAIFAEPLNCVMSGLDKIRILPGETAVVIGAGPIGLYFAYLLKYNGAGKVIVAEQSETRRNFALEMGADMAVKPEEEQIIFDDTAGRGADVVIDTAGCCLPEAVRWVRSSGRILLFGQNFAAQQNLCQSYITRKELTIFGSYIGTYSWHDTVKFLETKPEVFKKMITHRLSLEEFQVGYEAMKNKTALEVILYPNRKGEFDESI